MTSKFIKLTRRQKQALEYCAEGKTEEEIALILGISKFTVHHYREEAREKLDAVNMVQAVAIAIRAGLIP